MKNKTVLLAAIGAMLVSGSVFGQIVRFDAVGEANVSGYLEFDITGINFDSCESNTRVTALDLTVTAGGDTETFALGDVTTTDESQIYGSSFAPVINNGCGNLAEKGDWIIGFWPDGWDGSPIDGDASLRVEIPSLQVDVSYAVQWVPSAVPTEPVPSLGRWATLLLVLTLGVFAFRFRHQSARS